MAVTRVYISHTSYCTGWNLDKILQGTMFAKGCRTSRFPAKPETGIAMLDWDFRNPDWQRHLEIVSTYDFEVVMAPDYFHGDDIDLLIGRVKLLKQFCPNVYIPIHDFHPALLQFDLALPCAPSFAKQYCGLLFDIAPRVVHLLGGSPRRQFQLSKYFPNLRSVDGNALFQSAIRHGAYWSEGKWHRTTGNGDRPTNEEAFRRSVHAVNKLWSVSVKAGG